MAPSTTISPRAAALVAVGAAVGAVLRWAIADAVGTEPGRLPWETLTVNVVGCLAIGVAAARWRPGSDRWLVAVTGVLGGFTTFSAFAGETRALLAADRPATALLYVGASLVGGLVAVPAGRWVAR